MTLWPRSARRGALTGLAVLGLLATAVFLVVTASVTAQGCTDSWTGGAGTTKWDTAANWSTGVVPAGTDTVCITASGTYEVVVPNETFDVASLTVGGPGSDPTLVLGSKSEEGILSADVSGTVDIAGTGTVSVAATEASLSTGSVTNAGTFSVLGEATLVLSAGSTFDNAGGTFSNASGRLAISTPSSQTATVELDSGGMVDNSGTVTVADTLRVDGGSICGNALEFGSGDNGTGGALEFSPTPGTGPACTGGMATDHVRVLNLAATLSGTIPASYTLDAGDNGGGFFNVALSGDVVNDGTFVPGFDNDAGTVSAASASDYLTNNGTVTAPTGGAFNAPLINNGTLTVDGSESSSPETSSLANGWSWENTSAGTITVGPSDALEISSPSGQTATLQLDSGGVIDNSGLFRMAGTIEVNGGSICGDALELGTGDGGTGGSLVFGAAPGTGPACTGGAASDEIQVLNVSATLSGTIPASYTLEAGDNGGSFFNLALSGDVVNDGTVVLGFDIDAGTVSATSSSDYLTNNGTVTVPSGGEFNAPLVNNGAVNFGSPATTYPETSSLPSGWSWQNTSAGTITVGSGDTLAVSSPSGESATFVQEGVIENSGTFEVADPITINGGTICADPLNLGAADEAPGTYTLSFAASPAAGPACGSGQATDQLSIYNVAATIETNIPAGYTVAFGADTSSFAAVATPGNITNAGTLEPQWGATLTVGGSNGTLTNTGTIDVPAHPYGSPNYIDAAAVDNTSGNLRIGDSSALAISGTYSQGSEGTFTPEIDGTTPNETYGQLTATGGSTLAGTLDIDTISGFSPTASNTFEVIKGGAVSGAFGTVLGKYPPENTAYGVTYDPDDVTLTVSGESTTTLTVAEAGDGSGTVSSAPAGIDCGTTCVAGFPQSQSVTLTETPAAGSTFTGWSGDCSGAATTCQVTLSTARSVTATFTAPGSTATSLQSSAEPSATAEQVTYTATVSPTPDGGTVAFTDAGPTISGCGAVAVNTSTGKATCATTYATIGSHAIKASYSGDASFGSSESSTRIQIVEAASTATSLHSSANPSTPGEQVTYTATVSPVPDGGTIAFTEAGSTVGGCGSVAVNTSTGEATCQATYATPGLHTIEARYSGVSDYGGSVSAPLGQVTHTASTTTSLESSANPSTPGQQVTYTATVSPTPDGGTVAFTDGGTTINGCGTVAVNTSTGKATCAATYTNAGSHMIVASYSGDTNFGSSPSSTLDQAVGTTGTSTGLQSSANPSTPGQQVTYTATVSPVPDGGTVAFTDGGTTITACGTVAVNTSTGKATCAATYGSAGSHMIVASYSGDTNFGSSPSSTLDQAVGTTGTSTGLQSSANPSTPGQQVTYTATVSPIPDGGTMAFTDGGTTINACGTVAVNTSTGKATCATTYTTAGPHSIVATFSGDANFGSSPSSTLAQVVGTASTATALQSSANPSAPGQQVTYTATVSPVPDGGAVAFTDGGTTITGCGTVAVNTSTGKATCATTYATAGPHSIVATYSGDTNFGSSPSSTLDQAVGTTGTSTGLQSSANPSALGAPVTYTATVSPVPDGGTVAFTDGGTTITACGTVAVNTSTGQATCAATYSTAGSHSIVASYSGDTNFAPSPSSTLTQTAAASTLISVVSSPNPSLPGQPVTFTATASPPPANGEVIIGAIWVGVNLNPYCKVPVSPVTGKASCQISGLPSAPGSRVTIEAWPDGGLAANRVSEIQVIGGQSAAATTTTLEPSANPSALGAPVTYTATVSPVPDGGTVAFTDGGVPIAGCYSVAVNPSNGSATCRVTYNLAGSHSLIAAYSGDANFRASQSATLSENTATPTTTTVQVYPNPSTPGQEVTYSATVSPDAVTFGIVEVEFVQVTQTSGGAKNVGICTTFAGLTDGTAAQVTCGPVANLSKGAHTVEAIYTGFSEAGTPYDFLPSTSAPYTQDVGVSATTIAPGQTAITTGVCSFNCKVSAKGPTSVPAPSCNLGKAADAASVSPGSGTFHLFTVPQALTQPAATKIANTLQATQNGYNTAKPSKIAAALPPTTCAVAGTANAAIARAGKALAAAMSTAQTFLGPKVSQVLASIYSTHPTHADIEAFSEELALANLTTYEPARTLARFTLFDAFELGRAAIAHQLGDKSVSQLNLSTVTLGSAVAHGKKGSKAPLTITPSVLGGRILRMLEIAGLSHRVTITLTVSTTTNGHTTRSTRTIRVI